MKNNRIVILVAIFSFIFLPYKTLAADTIKVIFNTSFSNGVDSANISGISIMMDDDGANTYEDIILTKDNNYKYEITGILNGNIRIDDMFVLNDNSGKYELKYEQNRKSVNEIEIKINVSMSNTKDNTTTIKVNEAVLGDIFGDKYVEKHTQVLPSYGTEEGYKPSIPSSDDKNNTSTSTTPSTNASGVSNGTTTNEYGQTDKDLEEQSRKIEESRKEAKKQEEIDKRNNIYTIILFVVIIVLIIAIIFVIIKFANANK